MSETTLAIQYFDTAQDLVLHAADGTPFEIEKATAGETSNDPPVPTQAAVSRRFLLTSDFALAVKTGTVAFAAPAQFTAAEQALAVDVVRFLLKDPGAEMIAAGHRMLDGEKALEKLRDAYNASHAQVTTAITGGNLLAAGAAHLVSALEILLDPKVEEAAVASLQQALDEHNAAFAEHANSEDISQTDLQAYYDERAKREAALAAAQAKLAAVQSKREAEFGSTSTALEEAAQVMDDLKVTTIGTALSWNWTPPT